MPRIIDSERIPIHLWPEEIDPETMQQAKNLANLPFAFHHIAIMPDAHLGYGMPIGGILATDDTVIPNAVGVDIGCGVCAVKTDLHSLQKSHLKTVISCLKKRVPRGFKHHQEPVPLDEMPDINTSSDLPKRSIIAEEFDHARTQIGTLGGGNHFIEFQIGTDGFIWFMIHSGSRNLGYKVAQHYNGVAADYNKKIKTTVLPSWQLAYLPVDSPEGTAYLLEMNYCLKFAEHNRMMICSKIKEALIDHVSQTISFDDPVHIAHNYVAKEKHYGKDVYIHRKGATRLRLHETGIIPGSQGSSSYIVSGKGNPESFFSCSHGAGRKLGRRQAIKKLDLKKEKHILDRKNVIHAVRSRKDLEEAPGAYKDITEVIDQQRDLLEVSEILTPMGVIKG